MKKSLSEINFPEIFKDSWKVAWRNRYLWWFGFFVSLTSSGGFNFSFPGKKELPLEIEKEKITDFISQNLPWLLAGIFLLFILIIIFSILGMIGRGALIDSIKKNLKGKVSTFKIGFSEGRKNFFKIFFISMILGISIISALIILFAPVIFLFLSQNYLTGTFIAILALVLFLPLVVLAAYLKTYAQIYCVLGNLSVRESLENGYNLFKNNLFLSLIMGLIFIPINIIFGLLVFLAIIFIAIILALPGVLLYLVAGKIGVAIITGLGIILIILMMLLFKSFFEVLAQTAWILFFETIAKEKKEETIIEPAPQPIPMEKALPMIEAREK